MYAVFETGGKQYRARPGDFIQIEKIEGDVGTSVQFDKVLFVSEPKGEESSQVWIGKPLLQGAAVKGEVVGQGRGDKINIFKFKRRKQYRRRQGHRQFYTQVLVLAVANGQGQQADLGEVEKKEMLTRFQSQLTPKGQAFTPKTLGSRVRAKGGPVKVAEAKAAAPQPKKTASGAKAKKSPSKKTGAKKTASTKKAAKK